MVRMSICNGFPLDLKRCHGLHAANHLIKCPWFRNGITCPVIEGEYYQGIFVKDIPEGIEIFI